MRFSVSGALALLPLTALFLLPLAAALLFVLPGLIDSGGFRALMDHPQLAGALRLTLLTGVASAALSLVLSLLIVHAAGGASLARRSAFFLAVPHLSLALGLAFVIMPSGVVARLLAPATGWTAPPQWVTTQDPWGITLIAALVLKETPFLVWAFASLLNRDDMRRLFEGQSAVAKSLGHGNTSVFLRVILPQLLPRAAGPLVAVVAYALTVVDMALVVGPGQPPTLAQLVWTDLNDADPLMAARGGAGVLLLSAVVLAVVLSAMGAASTCRAALHGFYGRPPSRGGHLKLIARPLWPTLLIVYGVTGLILLLQSIAARWPFPDLLPAHLTAAAWRQLVMESGAFATSLSLALATSLAALTAVLLWLEWAPRRADALANAAAVLALTVPALLLALGQYRVFLTLGITGTWPALFLAHAVPVAGYVFLLLAAPYRAFDPRWQAVAGGLSTRRLRFLLRIKWPMLKAPILAAAAVGFAVSAAQFVTAQLAAAGRFSTLPMEAVTLSSGGNRPLIAAYGFALTLLPLAAFLLAAHFGRPRWRLP